MTEADTRQHADEGLSEVEGAAAESEKKRAKSDPDSGRDTK